MASRNPSQQRTSRHASRDPYQTRSRTQSAHQSPLISATALPGSHPEFTQSIREDPSPTVRPAQTQTDDIDDADPIATSGNVFHVLSTIENMQKLLLDQFDKLEKGFDDRLASLQGDITLLRAEIGTRIDSTDGTCHQKMGYLNSKMAKLETEIERNLNEREKDYNSRLEGIRTHMDTQRAAIIKRIESDSKYLDDAQSTRHKETIKKTDNIERELETILFSISELTPRPPSIRTEEEDEVPTHSPPATSTPLRNPCASHPTSTPSPPRRNDSPNLRTPRPRYDSTNDEENRGRSRERRTARPSIGNTTLGISDKELSKAIMKKPDAFDGKRGLSARTFMTQMETYFLTRTVAMGEIEKVYAVLTNMGNNPNAAAWTQPLLEQRNKGVEHPYLQSWEAFRTAFLLNFDDPTFQLKASDELMAITQTSSVAEYASRFRSLSAQVSWNDETLTAGFKRGLKPHIRTELMKATLFDNGRRSFEEWVTVAITLDNVLYTRTDRMANLPDRTGTNPDPRSRGVLVPEDQKELRRKEGRCIKCGKPGHQVRECRGRWTLEMNKTNPVKGKEGRISDDATEDREAAGLSPNTHIKFHKITEPIETLVDSGSSCNFIDISFARKNKLSLIALPNEREVQGINGKILQNRIRFKIQEKFEVEGREFNQKFYAMPLGGTNTILGMDWLKTAKPIIKWNPFEVCWEDEEILQGRTAWLPDEILDFADIFSEEAFKELPPH
ncbi:Transposon Tf2-1 polyprotein [Ceratobasidium theobromae]|uniref:Transposon Tf2-1 polyprotein n=1 Tax=Ceratobasidium theobromae TaxID=1582974 RepID=A0A5N5QLG9_9AGAM|nr:Transposon Tf2-1 polyprotein [Ceratobasidium theobromae]